MYLDSSVIVAALSNETATSRVKTWLANRRGVRLLISDWVITEVSSALSIKLRTGQLDTSVRTEALSIFTRWRARIFTVLPVASSDFHKAASFVDQHTVGLRGADALHAAVCWRHGATLMTLDINLAKAAPALGVKSELI